MVRGAVFGVAGRAWRCWLGGMESGAGKMMKGRDPASGEAG